MGFHRKGGAAEGASFPVATGKRDDPKLATTQWPPRMVDKNMSGSDVAVLQALLAARGLYGGSLDGRFGDELDRAVRSFQSSHGLDVDGVVGPLTWGKLLER